MQMGHDDFCRPIRRVPPEKSARDRSRRASRENLSGTVQLEGVTSNPGEFIPHRAASPFPIRRTVVSRRYKNFTALYERKLARRFIVERSTGATEEETSELRQKNPQRRYTRADTHRRAPDNGTKEKFTGMARARYNRSRLTDPDAWRARLSNVHASRCY